MYAYKDQKNKKPITLQFSESYDGIICAMHVDVVSSRRHTACRYFYRRAQRLLTAS